MVTSVLTLFVLVLSSVWVGRMWSVYSMRLCVFERSIWSMLVLFFFCTKNRTTLKWLPMKRTASRRTRSSRLWTTTSPSTTIVTSTDSAWKINSPSTATEVQIGLLRPPPASINELAPVALLYCHDILLLGQHTWWLPPLCSHHLLKEKEFSSTF